MLSHSCTQTHLSTTAVNPKMLPFSAQTDPNRSLTLPKPCATPRSPQCSSARTLHEKHSHTHVGFAAVLGTMLNAHGLAQAHCAFRFDLSACSTAGDCDAETMRFVGVPVPIAFGVNTHKTQTPFRRSPNKRGTHASSDIPTPQTARTGESESQLNQFVRSARMQMQFSVFVCDAMHYHICMTTWNYAKMEQKKYRKTLSLAMRTSHSNALTTIDFSHFCRQELPSPSAMLLYALLKCL